MNGRKRVKISILLVLQDEKHPVRNLIVSDGYKKWLSHPQEKLQSIEAVFQLDQLCSISYLDVGEYQIQSAKI